VLEFADASVSLAKFCASVCRNDCKDVDEALALEVEVLLELLPAAASRFWKSLCKVANAPPPPGPPLPLLPLLSAVPDVSEPVELLAPKLLSICCNKAARLEPEVS